MSFGSELICLAQIELEASALTRNNIEMDQFMKFVATFDGIKVSIEPGKIKIQADSLKILVEFEKKCEILKSQTTQTIDPFRQERLDLHEWQQDFTRGAKFEKRQTSPLEYMQNLGATGIEYDSLAPEWSDSPFPQPKNGHTISEDIEGSGVIKRKFRFPGGQIPIPGDVIRYTSYECVIILPLTPTGRNVDELLKRAFKGRKLFYIGRDIHGVGFTIQSAYQLLPGNKSELEVTGSKMAEIQSILSDLDVTVSPPNGENSQGLEHIVRRVEPNSSAAINSTIIDTLQTAPVREKAAPSKTADDRRFPQPDGLKMNSELHDKSLKGFEGTGAIHMYFRFDGGQIMGEDDDTIQYLSYHKTGCLPDSREGRQLYGMIKSAANSKKLFVVAQKAGKFVIRCKVLLLSSDDYPIPDYLPRLHSELVKLGFPPSDSTPPLPRKLQAHHGESSDDEEEERKLITLRKGGPFDQPDNGILRFERDPRNLNGVGNGGRIMMYVRFAGGKMKVKGYKPSKSFEIQYSQVNIVAALPGTDKGRKVAAMLKTAFDRRLLFSVGKKDGEPSFRVRPTVSLLTAEDYPRARYLQNVTNQLLKLNIPEPSGTDSSNLVIHDKTSPQGGALPTTWATDQNQNANGPQPSPRTRPYNSGARPKQRLSNIRSDGAQRSPVQSAAFLQKAEPPVKQPEEDKCAICLAALSQQVTKRLTCGHAFHSICIDMALKSQTNKTCPYCKQNVDVSKPNSTPMNIQSPTYVRAVPSFNQPPATSPFLQSNHFNMSSWNPAIQQQSSVSNTKGTTGIQLFNATMCTSIDSRSLPGFEGYSTIVINYRIPPGIQQIGHPNPGVRYDCSDRKAFLPDTAEGQALLKLIRRAFDCGLTFTIGRSQTTGRDNQIIWNGIPHKTNTKGGKQSYGYPDSGYLDELRKALAAKGIR